MQITRGRWVYFLPTIQLHFLPVGVPRREAGARPLGREAVGGPGRTARPAPAQLHLAVRHDAAEVFVGDGRPDAAAAGASGAGPGRRQRLERLDARLRRDAQRRRERRVGRRCVPDVRVARACAETRNMKPGPQCT